MASFSILGGGRLYRCSVSSDMDVFTGGYFCMQLTKLSVEKASAPNPFDIYNGKKTCCAEIEVAKKILNWLLPPAISRVLAPHLLRGSDGYELDDKLIGPFPLRKGGLMCGTELRPGEIGYTYDTKTN
nr:tyrosyl-DNA phosphodiesterase 2 isoform X2 [Ipomoea batatas]